ncbi:MAG: helix-turn-helix domain-containing protein [Oscillospiraceae bacterium]|nr:helix-turn-helix domain-containing protein [Oscillospiraceae bacterium]
MDDKKMVNVEIGKRIKLARDNAGLTQERFSELVGMGTKSISAIERGVVGVSIPALQRICKVLSISSDYILLDNAWGNDVQAITDRLKHLSPEQFAIANDILNKLIEGFAIHRDS